MLHPFSGRERPTQNPTLTLRNVNVCHSANFWLERPLTPKHVGEGACAGALARKESFPDGSA